MKSIEKYSFDSFIELLKNEPFTIFVGAGISFYSGIPLVLGDNGIIPTMLNHLPSRKKDNELIINSGIQFELFFESILSVGNYKQLFKIFNSNFPTFGHRLFSELCKKNIIKSIVTTNFDLLFEKALSEEIVEYKLFTDKTLKNIKWFDKLPLIKLHGSIENKKLGITLDTITSENHLNRCDKAIEDIFKSKKSPKNILFFGYSFSDYFDISPSIIKHLNTNKRIFILNHKSENVDDLIFKQLINFEDKFIFEKHHSKNIYNVNYNANKFIETIYKEFGLSKYKFVSNRSTKYIDIIKEWADSLTLSESHYIVANILYDIKELKRALYHYKKSLDNCSKNDLKLKADILNNIVTSYRYLGNYNQAFKYLNKGDEVAKLLGNKNIIGRNLGIRATINKNIGKREEAYKYHLLEEKVKIKSGNNYGLSFCYNNLALLLIDKKKPSTKDIKQASDYLNKAEILKKEVGDINGLAFTIRHRATISVINHNYNEAINLYKEEEKLRKRLTNYVELADCKGNQAIVYGLMGDYDKAKSLFSEETKICIKYNFIPALIDSYVKRIKFYISYKQNNEAKNIFKKAYKLATSINHSTLKELNELKEKYSFD